MAGQDDANSKTTPRKASVPPSKPQSTAPKLATPKSTAAKSTAKPSVKKAPAKSIVAAKPAAVSKPVVSKPVAAMAAPKLEAAAEAALKPSAVKAPESTKSPEPVKPEPVKAEVTEVSSAPKSTAASKPISAPKPAAAPKPNKIELAVAKTQIAQAAPKTVTPPAAFAGLFTNFILEDSTMDMNANIKDAMSDAQTKAKAAFEKGTEALGEVSDFTKGNVEAVIESGKILAEGVQGMGSSLVSESRASFEAMTGDIKELAAAKSPTDFFKLQGDMMRKNFDSAVATGSKNSEAMLKLMSDVMAPISGRFSLAMEKVRTAA